MGCTKRMREEQLDGERSQHHAQLDGLRLFDAANAMPTKTTMPTRLAITVMATNLQCFGRMSTTYRDSALQGVTSLPARSR